MPDTTQTTLISYFFAPLQKLADDPQYVIPSGNELYNRLMKDIEPELMTENLDGLGKKYAGETKEQAADRADRYEKAFEEYEKNLAAYLDEMGRSMHGIQRAALASTEQHDRDVDQKTMFTLESQFSTF